MAAFIKRVLAVFTIFIIVDAILIWIVNTNRYLPGIGVIAGGDQLLITLVLGAAAVIGAAIVAVLWKLKS
ncbi:MAG: hypothetical protein RTV72_16865 [Candidatus Thorarchaeota archaeon]